MGALRQPVSQNGRVHLHTIERCIKSILSMFALPGCQQISANTLFCDAMGLVESCWPPNIYLGPGLKSHEIAGLAWVVHSAKGLHHRNLTENAPMLGARFQKICTIVFCTRLWGSPTPLYLKPGHLKAAFFSARFRQDVAFPV